jgi:hypothetical protein
MPNRKRLPKPVIRGTFRLSVVIALLVAVYCGISGYIAAVDADRETWRIWGTLRCGERFLGQDMSSYTSPVRPDVIDIGRAGCSNSTFWASYDEIRKAVARDAGPPAEELIFGRVIWLKLIEALIYAVTALVAVNLAGVLFLGARGLFRWVRTGYR